jgi:hypothetical protein
MNERRGKTTKTTTAIFHSIQAPSLLLQQFQTRLKVHFFGGEDFRSLGSGVLFSDFFLAGRPCPCIPLGKKFIMKTAASTNSNKTDHDDDEQQHQQHQQQQQQQHQPRDGDANGSMNNQRHNDTVSSSSTEEFLEDQRQRQRRQPQHDEDATDSKWWIKLALNSNRSIHGEDSNNNSSKNINNNVLLVSNPRVPLSHATAGIRHIPNFVNAVERVEILHVIQDHIEQDFLWEGFDHRRRVKRYPLPPAPSSTSSDSNDDATAQSSPAPPPSILVTWAQRLSETTGLVPTHVSVEEYAAPKWSHSGAFASHHTVTSFESSCPTSVLSSSSSSSSSSSAAPSSACSNQYFVAQVPLNKAAIQHLNRPKQRRMANCWELESNVHHTDVYMEPGSLLVKTDECLWEWRHRIMASSPDMDADASNDAPVTPTNASSNMNIGKDSGTTNTDIGNDKKKKGVPAVPPVLILKFYNFPSPELSSTSSNRETTFIDGTLNEENDEDDEKDQFGYVASSRIARRAQQEADAAVQANIPMPPLHELLTIIITTSPVRSNPSTELLQRTMQTFCHAGNPDFCYYCRKVIVCDGFRTKQESEQQDQQQESDTSTTKPPIRATKFYSNDKQAMRNGIVTPDQAENFGLFKMALKRLCTEAEKSETPSIFSNTSIVELEERHGYGFALRHALRHCVSTRFVCVIQHDRTFMRPCPVQEVVHTMWRRPQIKYVGFSMRSNLMYRDIFNGKYGKTYGDQLNEMILRPPELLLDATVYGPDSGPIDKMSALLHNDKVRQKVETLAENYHSGSSQAMGHREWLLQQQQHHQQHHHHHQQQQQQQQESNNRNADGDNENGETTNIGFCQLSLTPTLFWYDNVHICDTAHYRDFIFHPSYKMVARGGFVEDKLSPVLKRTVERLGLQEGHARFGCYLLDDHSGTFFTGHLDGGSFLTEVFHRASNDSVS